MEKRRMTVKCGDNQDGFHNLMEMCHKEASRIVRELAEGEMVEVDFWTANLGSELIGACVITKKKDLMYSLDFDFSITTL